VLALASLGVLAWYVIFINHSYVHAAFAVRYLALPASFGFVALLLVLEAVPVRSLPSTQRWLVPGALAIALIIPAWGLHNAWGKTRNDWRVEAQRKPDGADLVSCANGAQGLRPDGKPDAVIELTLRSVTPPLSLLHTRSKPARPDVRVLQLIRDTPAGAWASLSGNYALGVTQDGDSKLINAPDSSVSLANPGTYALHYCADGQDAGASVYKLQVDGVGVDVKK
jgi:hypothetical protein